MEAYGRNPQPDQRKICPEEASQTTPASTNHTQRRVHFARLTAETQRETLKIICSYTHTHLHSLQVASYSSSLVSFLYGGGSSETSRDGGFRFTCCSSSFLLSLSSLLVSTQTVFLCRPPIQGIVMSLVRLICSLLELECVVGTFLGTPHTHVELLHDVHQGCGLDLQL